MEAFDQHFASFITQALNVQAPHALRVDAPNWSSFDAAAEQAWLNRAAPVMQRRDRGTETKLRLAVQNAASLIDPQNLAPALERRFDILPAERFVPSDRDLIYFKINHGYWEQLRWLFAPSVEISRMRPHNRDPYRVMYLDFGFADALYSLAHAMIAEGRTVHFDGVEFAISLTNGADPHAHIVADYVTSPVLTQTIVSSVVVGAGGFFDALRPDRVFQLRDGCFPKVGLASGALRETLAAFAAKADRIVFVVPPHLNGVQLDGAACPQETLVISGKRVHELWAATLYGVTRHILAAFDRADTVLVITQSAVFAAALGLYLKAAKDDLMASKRLFFFDLGQVLDIANPNTGGVWVAKYGVSDPGLFRLRKD